MRATPSLRVPSLPWSQRVARRVYLRDGGPTGSVAFGVARARADRVRSVGLRDVSGYVRERMPEKVYDEVPKERLPWSEADGDRWMRRWAERRDANLSVHSATLCKRGLRTPLCMRIACWESCGLVCPSANVPIQHGTVFQMAFIFCLAFTLTAAKATGDSSEIDGT